MDISSLRHSKEKTYFIISVIFSILLWIPFLIIWWFILIIIWIIKYINNSKTIKILYWNTLYLQEWQIDEVYKIAKELSDKLWLEEVPTIFLVPWSWTVNAFALKFLSKKYIILNSELIDLFLEKNNIAWLKMVIWHELWHHAAWHVNFWKNLLIMPANFIPFLWSVYSRASEHTADNIWTYLCWDKDKAIKALITTIIWSTFIQDKINIDLLVKQEEKAWWTLAFLEEIYNFHPRLTKRIKYLNRD